MSTLSVAIRNRQWDLATLCLLLGILRAAETLPPDAVEDLLELLDSEANERGRG